MMGRIYLTALALGIALCLQTRLTAGSGNFYVGLLGYNNTEGIRCCSNETDDSVCFNECGLIFEVHVNGLNGTVHSKNLSDSVQLSLNEATTIPTSSVTNPLAFNFKGWPGHVNVSVVITATYDGNVLKRFDVFEHMFEEKLPTDFYYIRQVDSDVYGDLSRLTIVFRYRCNLPEGPTCFGDCLEHDEAETCPPTLPNPTSDIYTGFPDRICEIINGTVNCSLNATTPSSGQTPPTEQTTDNIDTTATPVGNSETTEPSETLVTTTLKIYQDSNTSVNSTTTSSMEEVTLESNVTMTTVSQNHISSTLESGVPDTSTEGELNSNNGLPTTTLQTSTNNPNKANVTNITLRKSSSATSSRSTVRKSGTRTTVPTSDVSTPDERSTKIDEDPVYWPEIVGGVLGGVALLSAIGFCMYYRRQKKLRKRQEIYNVNPKVLRNFEEYEENGTSGRADVPLETEQY